MTACSLPPPGHVRLHFDSGHLPSVHFQRSTANCCCVTACPCPQVVCGCVLAAATATTRTHTQRPSSTYTANCCCVTACPCPQVVCGCVLTAATATTCSRRACCHTPAAAESSHAQQMGRCAALLFTAPTCLHILVLQHKYSN
jgi:hypothetical protein